MGAPVEREAYISHCGAYRYLLRRQWDWKRPRALLVMLNPSTADAEVDDATIRSCRRLLESLGYGSFEVVNLYAFRATDPDALFKANDPIGPECDRVIDGAISRSDIAICAWGAHPTTRERGKAVAERIRATRPEVFCFGKTKAGYPKHPLYIKTGTRLEAYRP